MGERMERIPEDAHQASMLFSLRASIQLVVTDVMFGAAGSSEISILLTEHYVVQASLILSHEVEQLERFPFNQEQEDYHDLCRAMQDLETPVH